MGGFYSRWSAGCLLLVAVAAAGCGTGGSSEKELTFDQQLRKAAAQSAPDVRAREFIRIASEQFRAKDSAGGTQTVKLARQAADEITDVSSRVNVYCAASETMARVGQSGIAADFIRAASAAVEKIEDIESRARQLVRVAQAQIQVSPDGAETTLQQAEKLAETVPDAYGRVLVLAMLGRSYDMLARGEEAQRVFATAAQLSGTIEERQRQAMALAEIAAQQALGKRQAEAEKTFEQALAQCQQVEPALARVHAMADVAQKLSRAGSHARAHQLLLEAEKLSANIAEPDAQNEALLLVRSLMAKLPRQ